MAAHATEAANETRRPVPDPATPALDDEVPVEQVLARLAARLRAGDGDHLSQLLTDLVSRDESPDARLLAEIVRAFEGLASLSPALVRIKGENTPATARAAQATENAWRRIDNEFGLLTSSQVATRMGARSSNRSYASEQRIAGRLLGVKRLNSFVYPGFQFDPQTNAVRPFIKPLLELAHENDRSPDGAALWLTSPSTYFAGARPVDSIDEGERILAVARDAWAADW